MNHSKRAALRQIAASAAALLAGSTLTAPAFAQTFPAKPVKVMVTFTTGGAADITADTKVRNRIKELQEGGYGHYPVCVAKTQSSFSTDPNLRGAPSGHVVNVREVRLAAGAEFVVMVCGDIMTMPGLPKIPSAEKIDLTDDGKVVGLF